MIKSHVNRIGLLGIVLTTLTPVQPASAQDIPGIENCTAEKAMDRRTSCLQSNVNYLKAQLTQLQTVSLGRIEAANRQIDALKALVIALQATVAELKAAADKKPAETPKPDASKATTQKNETPADTAKK